MSACATCDGFFFRGKSVAIVGGGNTAVEEALYLAQMCEKVTLIHRRDSLRAEKVMQQRLFEHPKIEVLWNHVVERVIGTENPKAVTASGCAMSTTVRPTICRSRACSWRSATIRRPRFSAAISTWMRKAIPTRPGTTRTSVPGVFAAGDVQDRIYRQAVTAAGSGCMAALDADRFLAGID